MTRRFFKFLKFPMLRGVQKICFVIGNIDIKMFFMKNRKLLKGRPNKGNLGNLRSLRLVFQTANGKYLWIILLPITTACY